MSRFVPAGADSNAEPVEADSKDAWAKARQQIEATRTSKRIEPGTQDDGRSLYEVLQANKAAKQEAFEEAGKLRNQFRALDDSEIEFLDAIRDSERQKDEIVKQETAEQLNSFREARLAAEQDALKQSQSSVQDVVDTNTPKDMWTASRKRRRVADMGEPNPASKLRRASTSKESSPTITQTSVDTKPQVAEQALQSGDLRNRQTSLGVETSTKPAVVQLGLGAYKSSDDEDDDDDE